MISLCPMSVYKRTIHMLTQSRSMQYTGKAPGLSVSKKKKNEQNREETYLPLWSSTGLVLAKTLNLIAAAIPFHNPFPVFCERFSFFPPESDTMGGAGRGSFRVGKLVARNNSYMDGVGFVSSSIRPKFERENEVLVCDVRQNLH